MALPSIDALVQTLDDDDGGSQVRILAPALGLFRLRVGVGELVSNGELIGDLEILNKRLRVRLPRLGAGVALQVARLEVDPGWAPVDHGAPLLSLTQVALGNGEGVQPLLGGAQAHGLDLPPEARAIPAPIEGQYYASPGPDEPPFIKEGDIIKEGQTVGLIEVMKFFYEIHFEQPGFEQGARVLKITAEDARPVESGAAIAWVVPA